MIAIWRIPPHLLVAASAWFGRLAAALMGLYTIRLLTSVLGTDQYAVFALLAGLQGWYMLADLGLGSSLQNFISERRAHNEPYAELVGLTGMLSLILVLVGILSLVGIAQYAAPIVLKGFTWLPEVHKVRNFIVSGTLCLIFSLGTISYKIWYAEQKGYIANLMPTLAAALSLGWVWHISSSGSSNNLLWCLVAMLLPQAALPAMAFLAQVSRNGHIELHGVELQWPLMKRALKFWGFAVMSAGVLQIDYLMMSQFLTGRDIVVYTLATKIFALVFFVYSAVLSAFWPVCAEEISRNRWGKVVMYMRRYIACGVFFVAIATVAMHFYMPYVVDILSPKHKINVPVQLILLLGLYQAIRVWTDTFSTVLQSMSYLRPFLVLVPIQAGLNILSQWILIPRIGLSGVVVGLICSYCLTVVWALPLIVIKKSSRYSAVS